MARHRTPSRAGYRAPKSGHRACHAARYRDPVQQRTIRVRSVLLTPWLSVSFGFVIASCIALTTPRAVLSFPAGPGDHCQVVKCSSGRVTAAKTAGHGRRAAAATVPGQPTAPGQPIHMVSGSSPQAVANPVSARLSYGLLPSHGRHFIAMIVIIGRRAIGTWTLQFTIPGARINLIMWARWMPTGINSGIASGSPWPWQRTPLNLVRIIVVGTGRPGRPSFCAFDGAKCTFGAGSALSPAASTVR